MSTSIRRSAFSAGRAEETYARLYAASSVPVDSDEPDGGAPSDPLARLFAETFLPGFPSNNEDDTKAASRRIDDGSGASIALSMVRFARLSGFERPTLRACCSG